MLSSLYLGLGFLQTLTLVLPAGFTCLRILPGQRESRHTMSATVMHGAVRLAGIALDKAEEQEAEGNLIYT